MADNNQKVTKKSTQASAKHYWGKNAHLNNSSKSPSSAQNSAKKATTAVVAGVTASLATKGASKALKRTNGKTLLAVFLSLLLALALGVGACFLLGRNDTFELVGAEEITLSLGSTYKDEGVKIVEYGFDISSKAIVSTNLKINENGEYYADYADKFYIAYTVKSVKFGFVYNVQKIRFITFEGVSEGGE